MKRVFSLLLIFTFFGALLNAQTMISLSDIWNSNTLSAKGTPGFRFLNDGQHYTLKNGNEIDVYDIVSGEKTETLFDAEGKDVAGFSSYQFSPSESYILFSLENDLIYRHSFVADYYILDRHSGVISRLFEEGKIRDLTFSPDEKRIAFSYKNNLYVYDIASGKTKQITQDGEWNKIINGTADWVYEEEFAITRMYDWSPNSDYIAWVRLDESEVEQFTMTEHKNELYPEYYTFKYPKVGEKNSRIELRSYKLETNETQTLNIGSLEDMYIPRMQFMPYGDLLCVTKLNRHQNDLELVVVDVNNGESYAMLQEKSKYYVDIHDNLHFLKNKEQFVWTSEKDGFNHIYLYDLKGKELRQLTKGDYDVTSFYGVDEEHDKVFFQAAKYTPMNREVYSVDLNNENSIKQLSKEKAGTSSASFSSNFDYYVLNHSEINVPPTYTVFDRSGKDVRVIEDNTELKEKMKDMSLGQLDFIKVKNRNGHELNAYMVKPSDFDPDKEYPLFMYLYGGPGSQQVVDRWGGRYFWWFQMLADKGVIIACVDNRGTGARGEEFKKQTYLRLGEKETHDQIDAAKYFGSLDYIDASRIGIFGWSYGGYMSTNCLLHGNDVFKMAIAVAPVTNWRWYDSIYTERFMRTEKENPDGYRAYSPINYADRLKGNYLLIHGTGDDNVHFQHTVEMAAALIKEGKDFETMFYPNRNHGIYGDGARLHLFNKMTNFIDRTLLN